MEVSWQGHGFGPAGQRYTAIGNAMHVGMASWLANRITKVSAVLPLLSH